MEDGVEDDDDPSMVYNPGAQSQSPLQSPPEDASLSDSDLNPKLNSNRREAVTAGNRARGTRDSLAAVRARGRGQRGRVAEDEDVFDDDEGDTTANITAMPLPGARKR